MSFLFANDTTWSVANWVSRGFFGDAEAFLEDAPALADDIKFCVETETDTIDLRNANREVLSQLLTLVKHVVNANRATEPHSFHDPEALPAYLHQLEQLRITVATLLDK